MKQVEHRLETLIFGSRWLLAPFYLGLVLALGLLLVKFAKEFLHFTPLVFTAEGSDVIIGLLSLVDVVMVANLLIIIVFAGYENFVSRIHTEEHEDRPDWMGHVESLTNQQLAWKMGIHMTFVVSGLLFALMDRIAAGKKSAHAEK
jgi:uncharacterized protein (TIGR00645 family)